MAVAVADKRGLKRICMSCGNRFYDMNKRPVTCPACQTAFSGEMKVKARRPRPAIIDDDVPVAKAAVKPVIADDEDEIVVADEETVSLEEVEEEVVEEEEEIEADLELDPELEELADIEDDLDDDDDDDDDDEEDEEEDEK